MKRLLVLIALVTGFAFSGCQSSDDPAPYGPFLVFKFKFDPNQERFNSFGQPATVPNGNAAQSPAFNAISGHYVELIPTALTTLGGGEIVYQGPETNAGGAMAIDFNQAKVVGENEVFLSIPIDELAVGTYEYVRVSVSYQNYDITYNASGFSGLTGTLASFVGYNTYITNVVIDQESIVVNDDKLQGFWAFETTVNVGGTNFTQTTSGQAPVGATTVPNPIFASSPIPQGSCLVTGAFETPLTITGNETEDVEVVLSVSTNQSFEWTDPDGNGQYDPLDGDVPVDMGLRGLKAIVQ